VSFVVTRRNGLGKWVRELPPVALVAGVLAVGIPAATTIFSFEWNGVPKLVKVAAAVMWAVSAVVLVVKGVRHDTQVSSIANETRTAREQIRNLAEATIYDALLRCGYRLPEDWEFTAYIFNRDTNRLEPVWPRPHDDPQWSVKCFEPGKGATGLAWKYGALIVKYGDEVSDATHGLDPEQQKAFAEYRTVAAAPIYSDAQDKVGVLSCITRKDSSYFDDFQGQAVLRETATTLGCVLTNISTAGPA
jgi:hypothetical protein